MTSARSATEVTAICGDHSDRVREVQDAHLQQIGPGQIAHCEALQSMTFASRFSHIILLLMLSVRPVHANVYKTARGLYEDCAAGESGRGVPSTEKRRRCADYIGQIFDNWNLNQDNGICSQHVGVELPGAYVDYWRARGMGLVSGVTTSAETSVNEFLDSQKRPCQTPDPKTNPP